MTCRLGTTKFHRPSFPFSSGHHRCRLTIVTQKTLRLPNLPWVFQWYRLTNCKLLVDFDQSGTSNTSEQYRESTTAMVAQGTRTFVQQQITLNTRYLQIHQKKKKTPQGALPMHASAVYVPGGLRARPV